MSSNLKRRLLAAAALAGTGLATMPPARAADPIRIGVIAEQSSISGAAIPNAAQLAADEINAKGGVDGRRIELVIYDDHSSSADAVRAFQRAASQDHVNAVIASYISEVVLALEPWSARLHMPMITPGAASDTISANIHKDYDHYKYAFHGYLTSGALATLTCAAAKDLLVDRLHMKTAVIMSEDAAWTTPLDAGYEACLANIGLKVIDHVRFSPDTTDFTPIFNKFEGEKPDVIVTGISHVGVQPTTQWTQQQVPIAQFGISSQATSSTFWKDTNGSAQGVIYQTISAPGIAITPVTNPFTDNYIKRFGITPSYCGYTTYDEVYYIADAVRRAGSTDPDKLVAALETTSWTGTIGKTEFTGKDDPHTHTLKTGAGLITGLMVQWQDGKQMTVWPADLANTKLTFPAFVRLAAH